MAEHTAGPGSKGSIRRPTTAGGLVTDTNAGISGVRGVPGRGPEAHGGVSPPFDQTDLDLVLQNLNPITGINNFQYVNQGNQVNLKNLLKSPPLKVLELVLDMVTTSDKWVTEVST